MIVVKITLTDEKARLDIVPLTLAPINQTINRHVIEIKALNV